MKFLLFFNQKSNCHKLDEIGNFDISGFTMWKQTTNSHNKMAPGPVNTELESFAILTPSELIWHSLVSLSESSKSKNQVVHEQKVV